MSFKSLIGEKVRDWLWIKNNFPDHSQDDGYNRKKDFLLKDRFLLGPIGTVLTGKREIDREATTVHRGVEIRTPPWIWIRFLIGIGRYKRLGFGGLGIHPYCGNEYNHYHFLVDVMPRILALKAEGFGRKGRPILINSAISESLPFKQFCSQAEAKNLQFEILSGLVRVDNLRVINQPGFEFEKFQLIQEAYGFEPEQKPFRKVFLIRAPGLRRPMINQDELVEVMKGAGFEIVDFAKINFIEQMKIASETRWLVAVHGAGITNFIFHIFGSLSMLELRPDYMKYQFFFKDIAASCGYDFSLLKGPSQVDGSFEVDPKEVISTITEW